MWKIYSTLQKQKNLNSTKNKKRNKQKTTLKNWKTKIDTNWTLDKSIKNTKNLSFIWNQYHQEHFCDTDAIFLFKVPRLANCTTLSKSLRETTFHTKNQNIKSYFFSLQFSGKLWAFKKKKHNFATPLQQTLTTYTIFFGLKINKKTTLDFQIIRIENLIVSCPPTFCILLLRNFFLTKKRQETKKKKLSVNEFIIQYCTFNEITYSK